MTTPLTRRAFATGAIAAMSLVRSAPAQTPLPAIDVQRSSRVFVGLESRTIVLLRLFSTTSPEQVWASIDDEVERLVAELGSTITSAEETGSAPGARYTFTGQYGGEARAGQLDGGVSLAVIFGIPEPDEAALSWYRGAWEEITQDRFSLLVPPNGWFAFAPADIETVDVVWEVRPGDEFELPTGERP